MEKNIIEVRNEWTMDSIKAALRTVQSKKCRLTKQKERPDYEEQMLEVLAEEKNLQDIRNSIQPAKKAVTSYTAEDIKGLTYEATIRAIKSIQSKKCLTQYATDQTEYNEACRIESLLKEHRDINKPLPETVVTKLQITAVIEKFEAMTTKQVKKELVVEALQELIEMNN